MSGDSIGGYQSPKYPTTSGNTQPIEGLNHSSADSLHFEFYSSSVESCQNSPPWSHGILSTAKGASRDNVDFRINHRSLPEEKNPAEEAPERSILGKISDYAYAAYNWVGDTLKSIYHSIYNFIWGAPSDPVESVDQVKNTAETTIDQDKNVIQSPVVNLRLLDHEIDEISDMINNEIAKGANANLSLLIRMIMVVSGYLQNNEAALNRIQQKIHSRWMDENHPKFKELKSNENTQWLFNASGKANIGSAGLLTAAVIGCLIAGYPADKISAVLQIPQVVAKGVSDGLGQYAQASSSGDAARSMEMEHRFQVLQREINEYISQVQNSRGQESDIMRLLKEFIESEKQHRASVMRSGSSN